MTASAPWLGLTIGAYAIGVTRQRLSGRHPLVNPTLITIGIVAAALIGFFAGSLTAILSSLAVGWPLGLSHTELLSLAPKSATAAVSMEIAAKNGGTPAVTAVLTILTGVTGAIVAPFILNWLRIERADARGFSMGLTSHGIATARAFQESETAGAFAGLAMALNAVATAILAPVIFRLLLH